MASFNKAILMGNLTRDPELRYTQSNMAICKVGVALNSRRKDAKSGEWLDKTTYVDVTLFGKRAESFEKYHRKGASAFFEGRLELDQWDDKKTGQKRSKLYVVADNWEFVKGGDQKKQQDQGWQPSANEQPAGTYGDNPGADFIDADSTPF